MERIQDLPVDLLRAITHANKILDWFENLTEEDTPPEWMWPFDELVIEWFEDVKAKNKEKYGGGGEPDDPPGVEMMSNEAAVGRGRNA